MVSLGRCNGSCNTLDDLSVRTCVLNKTEDVNLNVFIVITRINESKASTKRIHVIVNVKLMVVNIIQIKSGIKICVDVIVKIQQKIMYVKTIMFGILVHKLVKLIYI